MLLEPAQNATRPKSCKIEFDWGQLVVVVGDDHIRGTHCVINGPKEDIIKWLKPFDGVLIGNGNPMMEKFKVSHIKKSL